MAARTWEKRELPILEQIATHDEDGWPLDSQKLQQEMTDVEPARLGAGLRALLQDGYIAAQSLGTHDAFYYVNIRLAGKGRRVVGQWPDDAYDALLAGLDARLSAARDTTERSRLERFRDAVLGLGREVAGEVIADVLRRGGV
jgi:hypothetical protein